jgi:hypothetical protein
MEKDLGRFATGYGVIKYYLGQEYYGKYTQWVYLSYDEMLLMYAECLAQCGQYEKAIQQVDLVRARVGMKGLKYGQAAYKGDKSTLPDLNTKEGLVEEILRERACELGMSNNRYYDMIRYKRTDWMTKKLHGLITFHVHILTLNYHTIKMTSGVVCPHLSTNYPRGHPAAEVTQRSPRLASSASP